MMPQRDEVESILSRLNLRNDAANSRKEDLSVYSQGFSSSQTIK